ncbi:MAG: glycerophosphodiester phosphodiesterase [Terracoccus sp.]
MTRVRPYLARTPVALAHRGGALYPPNVGLENTMTAFGNAVGLGYTHLETDVHVTRDGRVVAFHDSRLDRVTDRKGLIRDLPWAEVSRARLGSDRSEGVSLLTDVIEAFPGTYFNVDLKAHATAGPLWQIIERYALHDLICVGSFKQHHLSQFRRLAKGSVAMAAGVVGTALMRFSPASLSRVLHTPADVLQVPATVPVAGRRLALVTDTFVQAAHRAGRQVHVWTIDDPVEMTRLLDLGVDGLVTDRIDVLKDVLTERGAWTGTS